MGEINPMGLQKAYEGIKHAIEEYDFNELTGILESLSRYNLPEKERDRVKRLSDAADEFEWEQMSEILNE